MAMPKKNRAERILKDLEDRKTTGLAAMDLLEPWRPKRTPRRRLQRKAGFPRELSRPLGRCVTRRA
jgi:hypothetical protein